MSCSSSCDKLHLFFSKLQIWAGPWWFFCGQESSVRSPTAGCHGLTDWGGILSESISSTSRAFWPGCPVMREVPELGRCDDFPLQRLSAIHFRPFVCWPFVNCVNSLIATSACDKDLGSRVQTLPGLIAARRMFCQNHQCLSKAAGPPMLGGHILTGISREINSLAHLNSDNIQPL